MPDLPTTQSTRFCLSVLLLFPLAVSAQSENWYRVELLVFAHPAAGASEQWEPTPDLAYPDTSRFLVYPGEQSVSAEKQATEAGLPDTTTGSRVDAAAIALPAAQ